jgi:hypothetical protein
LIDQTRETDEDGKHLHTEIFDPKDCLC